MEITAIILALAASFVAYYIKYKIFKPEKTTTQRKPLSQQPQENDKVILVRNVDHFDVADVLNDFCKQDNEENNYVVLRLTKIAEKDFAITCPFDIDFDVFCYLINYLHYPMDVKWHPKILGWATMKDGEEWIDEELAGKKAMLFIPPDDKDYDNIFLTTSDNIGYKIGFAISEGRQRLSNPKRIFEDSPKIPDLSKIPFEDFK